MRHRRWWIVESEGLRELKWIQQEHQKVVCPSRSMREISDLGFPCQRSESWLGDKDKSHQCNTPNYTLIVL